MSVQAPSQTWLFLIRQGPFGTSRGNACVDMALTAATFDQRVSVAFVDEGVFHLLDGQDGDPVGLKNLSLVFPALELYEVNEVMVESGALREHGLDEGALVMPVTRVNMEELAHRMDKADQVFIF